MRYPLPPSALERLAVRTGTPLPWGGAAKGTRLHTALGGAPPATDAVEGAVEGALDPDRELAARGLLAPTGVLDARLVEALDVFATPEVFVDIELVLRRPPVPDGASRFRAWHRYRGGRVTAISRTGPHVELAWWTAGRWAHELAHLATATRTLPEGPGDDVPAAYLRLPYELLLGSGAALRERRPAVLAELMARHQGGVTGLDGTTYPTGAAAAQVHRLHTTGLGRLQVTVVGVADPQPPRTVGLVTWVLFGDGWRELLPAPGVGEPMVVVRRVEPAALGAAVARMVAGVRS